MKKQNTFLAQFRRFIYRARKAAGLIPLLPDYFLIRKNPLFNTTFYLENNPGALASPLPPALHYLYKDSSSPQNPSAAFNATLYLALNPDVCLSGQNPLVHYLRYGKAEGRELHSVLVREKMSVRAPTWEEWEQCAVAYRKSVQPVGTTPITIVIPVYHGFDETLNCLFSVVKSRIGAKMPCRLEVIDDQSHDTDLSDALLRLADMGLILLTRNEKNIGFVASVNSGMAQYLESDIILLHSDTEVYGDWVERLHHSIYCAPDIGTATPLSNNANICSYPLFCKDFPYSFGLQFSELDSIVHEINAGQTIDIPTGVGFCMYIRRACLEGTGFFDFDVIGHGCGEENDFCQCAMKQGWRSVLCADTFVRHLGRVFIEGEIPAKAKLDKTVMRRRIPDYESDMTDFCQKDPVRPLRERLDLNIIRHLHGKRMFMLHFGLSWGGGVTQHVDEMCAVLNSHRVSTVKAFPGKIRNKIVFSMPQLHWSSNARELDLAQPTEDIGYALRQMGFEHLHIHHTVGFESSFPDIIASAAAAAKITYDFTVHDYYCICPRIHMVGGKGVYCDCRDPQRCDDCLRKFGAMDVPVRSIVDWREMFCRFLNAARMVFVPDEDVEERLKLYYPDIKFTVRKHIEPTLPEGLTFMPRKDDEPLRVAVLGRLLLHKGREILKKCATDAQKNKRPIRFVSLGAKSSDIWFRSFPYIESHGEYRLAALTEKLRKTRCHMAFFPSVCPETYSYTLSQVLAAGLYPVCFDLGAIARRIKEIGWGTVLPISLWSDPEGINEYLLSCSVTPVPPEITGSIGGRYGDMLKDYYQLQQ